MQVGEEVVSTHPLDFFCVRIGPNEEGTVDCGTVGVFVCLLGREVPFSVVNLGGTTTPLLITSGCPIGIVCCPVGAVGFKIMLSLLPPARSGFSGGAGAGSPCSKCKPGLLRFQ